MPVATAVVFNKRREVINADAPHFAKPPRDPDIDCCRRRNDCDWRARRRRPLADHPVRIIVPYPAGGSTDVLTRILAERFKDIFGQPFVIENRAGAGGNIRIAALTGSSPDGYTIGAATIGHFAINQYLYNKMPYDPEHDMIPASLTWELPNVFVVPADHVPAKTLSEFLSGRSKRAASVTAVPVSVRRRICLA
jgi:tripartite-type tricarboxylate transporter receptor subunit TctC